MLLSISDSKTLHSNKWYQKNYDSDYLNSHGIDVCELCHTAIHKMFHEKELGKEYNTVDKLLEDEKIKKHIKFAKKQNSR